VDSRFASAASALLVVISAVSGAQGRVIALPDTNGANFSIADSAKALGSEHDYDSVLGFWHFRFQPRNEDGTFADPFTGHWSFEVKPGGGLMIDAFRADDPSEPMGAALYFLRLFNPVLKVWDLAGARAGGKLTPGKSWGAGGNIYLIQHTAIGIVRIRYFAIETDRFLWRSDLSKDNGKTWLRDYGVMEVNRIGK
jgi:hypothetical protein